LKSSKKRVGGLIRRQIRAMMPLMVTLTEIKSLAFNLPQSDRATLVADLLDSLPGVLRDDDEGIAEALRRSEEMDRDPSVCLSHEEFLKALAREP
jgi:putative addiction module component (TIGR02574 family)